MDFFDEPRVEARKKMIRKILTFVFAALAFTLLILSVINTYVGVIEYRSYVEMIGKKGNDVMDVYYRFGVVCFLSLLGLLFSSASIIAKGNKAVTIICIVMIPLLILCPTILFAVRL